MYKNNHTMWWDSPKVAVVTEENLTGNNGIIRARSSYKRLNICQEFWNKEHIPQQKKWTLTVNWVVHASTHDKNVSYTDTYNPPNCMLTFDSLGDCTRNGRKRMENTFLVIQKMHTYLVIIDFVVKTLGIRDIELKKKIQTQLLNWYTHTQTHTNTAQKNTPYHFLRTSRGHTGTSIWNNMKSWFKCWKLAPVSVCYLKLCN